MHAVYDSAYVENEGMHQVVVHTLIFNISQQCSKMPIDLERCVERELVARLKRTAFDAWRRDLARRKLVLGRLWVYQQYHGHLLRALLRFWAKESSDPRCGWSSAW